MKREGFDLPSNFTMTINTDLNVGALEEQLTVSGASPVVVQPVQDRDDDRVRADS